MREARELKISNEAAQTELIWNFVLNELNSIELLSPLSCLL
jgi:hypothetical protein